MKKRKKEVKLPSYYVTLLKALLFLVLFGLSFTTKNRTVVALLGLPCLLVAMFYMFKTYTLFEEKKDGKN